MPEFPREELDPYLEPEVAETSEVTSQAGEGFYPFERQAQLVNEAAQKFAEAIIESYGAVADRSVTPQELNAELTQTFFSNVVDNLRVQAEVSANTYTNFIKSTSFGDRTDIQHGQK